MRNLPFHDVLVQLGLNTFYNPETQAGGGFSALSNLDGNSEFRSLAVVGGSSKATAPLSGSILSAHYFEYTAPDRTRQRAELLYTSDGDIFDADLTTPKLITTVVPLQHATTGLRSAVTLNQIYFSSPAITQPFWSGARYAGGTGAYLWGVAAPGDPSPLGSTSWEEVYPLDDLTGISAVNGVASTNSDTFLFGDASLAVTKTNATVNSFSATLTDPQDWSTPATRTVFRFFFFLSQEALDTFVQLIASFNTLPGTNIKNWVWDQGDVRVGWNTLVLDLDVPDAAVGAYDPANHDRILFSITTKNVTDLPTVIFDSFQRVLHDGFPTLAVGAAGALTGSFRYRVSFVANDGTESNVGPVSGAIALTADKASLTAIPTSADFQVVARRIYRDSDGDGIFRLVTTIPDNVTTTYTDDTPTAALGGAIAPIAGDDQLDNTPPTRFSAVVTHNGRIFGVDSGSPNTVWPSDIGVPGAFPIAKQLTFDDTIVAMVSQQNGLLLYGTDHAYLLTGDGTDISPWFATQLTDRLGADTYRSVENVRNFNLVIHERRVYLYEDIREPWYISGPIQDQLNAFSASDIFVIHDVARTRLLFFVDAANVAFAYNYGSRALADVSPDGPGIDPFDPRTGVWCKLTFPEDFSIRCAAGVDSAAEESRLIIGCDPEPTTTDGNAYFIGEDDDFGWQKDSAVEGIAAGFTTHAFPLGEREFPNPQAPPSSGGRGEPRFLRLDAVGFGASTDWTFTINLLNDPGADPIATVDIPFTLPEGQISLNLPIPLVGKASWASISAACTSSTGRVRFRMIRLYYMPRTKFRGAKESAGGAPES